MLTKPGLIVTKSVLKCNWLQLSVTLILIYVTKLSCLCHLWPVTCIVARSPHTQPPLWKTQILHQPLYCMLHCEMVTQTFRASKKKNPNTDVFIGNYKKKQLTNQSAWNWNCSKICPFLYTGISSNISTQQVLILI